MVEHDGQVGVLLDKLDELGIADNTIVIYTTDNGAETFTWPDGGTTPFRGEKNTNWEGGYRVPALIRWPGQVPPRTEVNASSRPRTGCRRCWPPPASPTSRQQLLEGYAAGDATFKVHLDGYDQSALLADPRPTTRGASSSTGPTTATSPACATTSTRRSSWSSRPMASRSGCSRWCRCARRRSSTCAPIRSSAPSTRPAATTAGSSSTCSCCCRPRRIVGRALATFQEFPPRQKPGSFSIDQVMEMLMNRKGHRQHDRGDRHDAKPVSSPDVGRRAVLRVWRIAARPPCGAAAAGRAERSAAVLERRRGKQAILDFVAGNDHGRRRRLRRARRPDRHLRPGRHDLGRASALRPGLFALDRLAEMAPDHPEWKDTEPFKSVLAGDHEAMAKFTEKDWMEIVAVTHAGMSTADFEAIVADWLPKSKNPVFKRPVTDLVYQPMLEVMELSAGQRLPHLYRHRRRTGVRPHLLEGRLRHPAGAGHRIEHRHQVRDGPTASRC